MLEKYRRDKQASDWKVTRWNCDVTCIGIHSPARGVSCGSSSSGMLFGHDTWCWQKQTHHVARCIYVLIPCYLLTVCLKQNLTNLPLYCTTIAADSRGSPCFLLPPVWSRWVTATHRCCFSSNREKWCRSWTVHFLALSLQWNVLVGLSISRREVHTWSRSR